MKTRRLLAFVLCLAMLFSDATSTLASTLPDEGVMISDGSEQIEVLDTEVADTQAPGTEVLEMDVTTTEEVASTETTEVVVSEGTEEPRKEETESPTEVVETPEVVEKTIEVEEDIKTTPTTSLSVGYVDTDNNDQWVDIGTYTSFTDALEGINTFLAQDVNLGFGKMVQINMQADATLDCELDLGSLDVPLSLNLNGYSLIVTENRTIRADVFTPDEMNACTVEVAGGATLSILPFDPCGYGMSDDEDWQVEQDQENVEYTNWQNVNIIFDSANPGDLIVGQLEYEENYTYSYTTAHIQLNDVVISNAKNVTFEGNIDYRYNNVDSSANLFYVTETLTVNNKGDNGYENHYVELSVPTNCKNLVWYSDGAVAELIVNNTMTSDTESNLVVNGQLTVNNIHVESLDDPWGCFALATRHLYKADGTLESAGAITINGQITAGEGLDVPLNFRKEKWVYASESAEWPDHVGALPYTEGEVVATAPNLGRHLVNLSDAETGIWLFADRNEQGQLVAEKAVVEVFGYDENNERLLSYTSLEEAAIGMQTEFDGMIEYIIRIYDDIKLTADVTLPDFATYVRVEPLYRIVDVEDEQGNYASTYYETTFVNVDFNGHTISTNAGVKWSEAVAMSNSSEAKAQLYLGGEKVSLDILAEFNEPSEEYVYVNAAGETIERPESEYTWIQGVEINIPNSGLYLTLDEGDERIPSEDITRILDTDISVAYVDVHSGNWKITNLSLIKERDGSRVKAGAALAVTGMLTAIGGNSFDVIGALQVADIVVTPSSEDAYANLCFFINKTYGPENQDQLSYMADLIFTGNVTMGEGLLGTPIGFAKRNIILSYELDEEGNIIYEDEEQQQPRITETIQWEDEVTYETGEILATIAESSTLDESMFVVNREGISALVEEGKVKIGATPAPEDSKVIVEFYIEEEDRNIQRGYESVEEAFANMAADFGSREGMYTITVFEDVTLTENIIIPDFAKCMRFQSAVKWIQPEDGEGQEQVVFLTMDMNGHSITANGDIEWVETLKITNSSENASEIYIKADYIPWTEEAEGYCPTFRGNWYGFGNAELVDKEGAPASFGDNYTFINNVTIRVPNGRIELGSIADATHVIAGDLVATAVNVNQGTWKVAGVTIAVGDFGSFVSEEAAFAITGTLTATGGSHFEVRGKMEIGDIVLKPHSQDPHANLHLQIVKVFGPENPDAVSSSGQLTFTGSLTVEEGFEGTPIGVNKKHIILTYRRDENGEIMYEDEEKKHPCLDEEHIWEGLAYENGEVFATIAESCTLTGNMFVLGEGNVLAVVGDGSLKIGEAAVRVDIYIPEEDRGFGFVYESLEDAFAKMPNDFAGSIGEYNITLLKDTTLAQDVIVPDFVSHINWHPKREWIEHLDEAGNPIFIYDEEGNQIGVEGHDRITTVKLDMNGYHITANCDIEWSELIQITNSSKEDSQIRITADANPGPEGYWPTFRSGWFDENAELVNAEGSKFSFGTEYTWIDNVTIYVPRGRVEFQTTSAGTYSVNGELIVSAFKAFDGKWEFADVTIVGSTDGSFVGESAEVIINGKTTWLGGAGVEVRGALTLGDILVNANAEDPYANMWLEIVEMYNRDAEGMDEYFVGKGKLTFAGSIETAENFKAGKAVHISKKQIYYYQARDEHGNLLFHDEAQTDPMIWEDQHWDLPFESGETVAYVTDSSVSANLFGTNLRDTSFEIVEQELKAYKSAVCVEYYIEEEDRGIGFSYKTLEEALDNIERDFEGREGSYTFIILKDTELSEDIVLPNFVRNLRLQSEWMWREHYDENGNPIEIYDEEGNFMGIEGHHDVYVATLDLNGHSISLAGHIEVMEGLHVTSDTTDKGELISISQNGGVSLRQIDNGGLVSATGGAIEVSMDKPFVILDNVDAVAEKAGVDLWSLWGAYTVNGDITARFMSVRGTWTVEDVKVTTDLYLESGWYDEENDYGEPEGYLTADNVSIFNGHMNNSGRLVVKNTFTAKNSGIENYGTLIADKLMVPSGEFHNYVQVSVKDAEIEWFYNHTDVKYFEDDPTTPDEDEEHVEEWGALFICDTFKQSDAAFSYMDGSSEFIVNVDAVINNLCTGGFNSEAWNPANITRMPGATLQINEDIYPGDERNIPVCIGIFNKPTDKVAGMGMVEVFDRDEQTGTIYGSWFEPAFVDAKGEKVHEIGGNGWYMYKAKLERGEVLFTTDISNVRTQLVRIDQYVEEGKEDEAIWEISQDGNKVVAGGYTIFVYSLSDGDLQWLRDFKDWSDAVAYIDSLQNPNIGYVIELTENVNIDGPLTLPKNATEVLIRGLGDKQIELTCTGDISLSSYVAVIDIKLNASNSTVKLNGFNLIFDEDSIAYIGNAVGTKESILAAFNNSAVMIGKAVTGLAGLEVMWGSRIELGMDNTADASVAKKLQLDSSILVLHDSLTVEEVASWDDLNTVVIKDSNSFTITGTVYGPDVTWDESSRQYVGDKGVTADNNIVDVTSDQAKAKIRISAINIEELALNSNFAEGEVLVNAPNVSEAWFVTGSVYDEGFTVRTKIGSLTHKEDGKICYGAGDTTPKAVELRIHDDAMNDFIPYDTYATLAEAFAVIDSIGNAEGFYRIVLMDDVEIATMTTPSKAQALQIWVEDEQPKTITYGGDMKLNCRLIIANAILAPQSEKSKIDVGGYAINLIYGTKFAGDYKIASITGSGVTKGSEINLHDTEITVSGDVKNIAVLCLQNAVMTVEGTVNVGDVICFEDDGIPEERRLQSTLIGTAKVTRIEGKVTKVEPQITFAGDTWYEQSEMHIALQEKLADGSYKLLDFTTAEMTDVLAAGIPLAKAPKISSMMLLTSKENKAGSYITAKANGYVVARKDVNAVGVMLTYEYPFVRMEWNDELRDYEYFDDVKVIETYCETVADAVTEINNWNTARAYEIILLPQNATMAPASLKMPNAKAIESLTIKAQTDKADLRYTGTITFTSDVVLENVNFVQVSKAGVAYEETDTPAAVSVSTGGNELTINGKVTFNTPIKLDGKKKGTLNLNGTLVTITYYDQYGICGSITNFAEVNIRNTNENPETKLNQIVLGDYGSTAPTFSATVLNMDDYTNLIFYTSDMNAKLNVTDLSVNNGLVYVEGTVAIKNLEMNGETELDAFRKMDLTNVTLNGTPTIRGYREFTISGTVTSNTGNSVLRSAQKSESKRSPYLEIKGDVVLANDNCKIGVVVDDYMEVDLPKLENSPNATGMLLTAKKASADMFVPATVTIGNKQQNNIGNEKPYSEDKENGYVLMKSGNSIYVYYGKDISVKLADGTGKDLGYYGSVADAVKAIDAIKDKDASYIIELLKGYGDTTDTAVELKMPKFASGLMVMSDHKMYFNGKVALSAATALVVAGEAEFAADVAGKGTLALGSNMTVTVKGKVDTTNLVLNGGSVLDAKGVVNIGTITNNGSNQNVIRYGKDAKDITYLTIKGLVSGENSNTVLLQMSSETDVESYALSSDQGKVLLDNKQKIANIEKAALSCFEISINNEKLTTLAQAVKANKGVWHVAIDTDPDWLGTWLEYTKDGKTYTTYCLDYAQAVNEINTLADKSTDYIINICRKNTTIWDVNLTDTKAVSPITMPKANVANSVTIAYSGFNNWQHGMEFTGNISYSGNLGFVNCEIEAANISGVKTLTLDNTAFVTTGTVKADNVVIKGNTTWDAFGKTTVGDLDATEKGNSSYIASKPDAKGVPTFAVNGKVSDVTFWKVLKANATTDTAEANRYVDTYKDVSLVVAKVAGADRFMAYPFATGGNNEGITKLVAYKDAKNAVKNGNGDDMKVKLTYGQNVTYVKSYDEAVKMINNIGNKQGDYVIEFQTTGQVTTSGVEGTFGKLSFPSKAGLVTIKGMVDGEGNPTVLTYTGTIKTGVSVTFENIYLSEGIVNKGEFAPSFAITPATSSANVELTFGEGAMTPKNKESTPTTDLVFTSVSGKGKLTLDGRNVEVKGALTSGEFKLDEGSRVSVEGDVKVTTLNIADNAILETKAKFTAKDINVLDITGGAPIAAVIDADKAITITDIYGNEFGDALRIVTNRTAGKNESQLTISGKLNEIYIEVAMNMYDAELGVYREMGIEDVTEMFVSKEDEVPTKEQKVLTAPKASSANVFVAAYVENEEEQILDWETILDIYDEDMDTYNPVIAYVHDGGMYITDLVPLMGVLGGEEDDKISYFSYFMDWNQAVNQIDKKLNDKNAMYELVLFRSVGRNLDGTLAPIKNLTLPAKAKMVYVIPGMDEYADVFFTGTKLTAKTNMEIRNTNFVAVKQVEEDGETWYESTVYDMNIGNYAVTLNNIRGWADGYESKLGTISGSKKGHLTFSRDRDAEVNDTVASMIKGIGTVEFAEFNDNDENDPWEASYYVPKGISGVQNLILQPYTFVGAYEGDISVKNVYADRTNMYAKNIAVSGTVEMSDTGLSAGTETIGDGAIKLKDVVLNSKCGIYGSQDKNGKSLIQISGNISAGAEYEGDTEGLLQIGLFYNNDSGWVPLSNELVLLTAPKAAASWFVPNYSWKEYEQAVDEETGELLWDEETGEPILLPLRNPETGELLEDEEGNPVYYIDHRLMGWEREGYGTYKQGKVIYYGKLGE